MSASWEQGIKDPSNKMVIMIEPGLKVLETAIHVSACTRTLYAKIFIAQTIW